MTSFSHEGTVAGSKVSLAPSQGRGSLHLTIRPSQGLYTVCEQQGGKLMYHLELEGYSRI